MPFSETVHGAEDYKVKISESQWTIFTKVGLRGLWSLTSLVIDLQKISGKAWEFC